MISTPTYSTPIRIRLTGAVIASMNRHYPAAKDHGHRRAAAGPLKTPTQWTRSNPADEHSQHSANQETEEMSPNVNALTATPEHAEKGEGGSRREPIAPAA